MQAPTHLLAGIALQKVIDSALVKLEKKINKKKNPSKRLFIINLRWAFIPLIAFFLGQGFLDFLNQITFHDLYLFGSPQEILITIFNIVLIIWILKKWVLRDWKNLRAFIFWKKENKALWKNFRYLLGVTFASFFPDGEVVYYWITMGTFRYPEVSSPINRFAQAIWRDLSEKWGLAPFIPDLYSNKWAFFVELLLIFFFIFAIYVFSQQKVKKYLLKVAKKEIERQENFIGRLKKLILEKEEDEDEEEDNKS